jgi:metal-sulfur cluster biosynthetic enzyme
MMEQPKLNENPTVYAVQERRREVVVSEYADEDARELFDAAEVFELIHDIQDPEHPLSLQQLNVVEEGNCHVDNERSLVEIFFTPTVPHCSMSTLIGLSIRVKLLRSLPSRFKVDIYVMPGSHAQEAQVNKQLNDKERVAAALENPHLHQVINKCLTATLEV